MRQQVLMIILKILMNAMKFQLLNLREIRAIVSVMINIGIFLIDIIIVKLLQILLRILHQMLTVLKEL